MVYKSHTHKAVKKHGGLFSESSWLAPLFFFCLDLPFPFSLFSLPCSRWLPCLAVSDHVGSNPEESPGWAVYRVYTLRLGGGPSYSPVVGVDYNLPVLAALLKLASQALRRGPVGCSAVFCSRPVHPVASFSFFPQRFWDCVNLVGVSDL